MRAGAVVLVIALAGACGRPLELSIDVRSDLMPGMEVDEARVTLVGADGVELASSTLALTTGDDLLGGLRLLDADGLGAGSYLARVALLDGGAETLARERALVLTGDLAVTVLLMRTCEEVRCADGMVCVGGECVSNECGPGDVSTCPAAACRVASHCPRRPGCFRAECALGQCLYVVDESMCDGDGGLDAGAADGSVPDASLDAGVRDAGCGASTEDCTNGADDDCDGMTDCADTDCPSGDACASDGNDCTTDVCAAGACAHNRRPDGTALGGTMRCCAGAATDVATDRRNCGACGQACSGTFDCTSEFGHPQCDCTNANSQCHGGTAWVCSTSYFVCACVVGGGGCPAPATCVDDPAGPNYCQYP
ncbi:MAG: hypothetical protein AB7S26_37745 [Sandaracinaceae bacterium]